MAEINVTPLVDVMLVLLIIFMITTPMMNHKVKVDLPTKTVLKLEEEKATPMTLAIDDAGQMYLDDALIDQRALEDRLRREALRTPQPMIELRADRTTQYKQIAEAMAAVHAAGIVHCDLKPENFFVTNPEAEPAKWTLKVIDYGISRHIPHGTSVTVGQRFAGSVCWMAPEQIGLSSARLSSATDVWALGLIAFYLLTGKHYQRRANEALALADRGEPIGSPYAIVFELAMRDRVIDPPSQRATELGFQGALPEGFEGWFRRCIELDSKARFTDAEEAREALDVVLNAAKDETGSVSWVSPVPPSSPPPPAPSERPDSPPASLAETRAAAQELIPRTEPVAPISSMLPPVTHSVPSTPAPTPRRRWVLAALGVLSLFAMGAVYAVRMPREERRSPERSALAPPAPLRRACADPGMALIDGVAPFCIGRTEVTADEARGSAATTTHGPDGGTQAYDRFCNANRADRGRHPANCIDGYAARAWCQAHGGDLPTEAQWLRAAKGPNPDAPYAWGDEPPSARRLNACGRECQSAYRGVQALYDEDDGAQDTAEVDSFVPEDTALGLRHFAGNVSEWVLAPDGRLVARGGNWFSQTIAEVRVEARFERAAATRAPFLGFRCVMPAQEK
jgi:biopolymer transport protein ExbD